MTSTNCPFKNTSIFKSFPCISSLLMKSSQSTLRLNASGSSKVTCFAFGGGVVRRIIWSWLLLRSSLPVFLFFFLRLAPGCAGSTMLVGFESASECEMMVLAVAGVCSTLVGTEPREPPPGSPASTEKSAMSRSSPTNCKTPTIEQFWSKGRSCNVRPLRSWCLMRSASSC